MSRTIQCAHINPWRMHLQKLSKLVTAAFLAQLTGELTTNEAEDNSKGRSMYV